MRQAGNINSMMREAPLPPVSPINSMTVLKKTMTTVQLIEDQIQRLDSQSFAAFRNWFIEYEHTRWEGQIASDSEAGKLDFLIDEALAEHRAGKTKPL